MILSPFFLAGDNMNEELEKNIKNIKELFGKNFGSESLLQVGSSVNKDNYNDIDLLIISNNKKDTLNKIRDIFEGYKMSEIDDSIKISDYFKTEISFAIHEKEQFLNRINDYISGEDMPCFHKTWSTGYWLIEGYINDLKNSRVIIDNHGINNLIKLINKTSIYAENKILMDCREELTLKQNMLNKTTDDIEHNLIQQDLFLCSLRTLSLLSNCPLRGFKKIEEKIEKLPNDYRKIIMNLFKENNVNRVIKLINEKLDGVNRLYMGTWQFNGQFKTLTENEIISLLNYAKSKGIIRYDTALAYGKTEEYISKSNCRDDIILTKIPAKTKPKQDEICNINDYYTKEYIYECLTKSLKNLDRNFVDILLLHNWHDSWNQNPEVIEWLLELKEKQLVKRIGISLPNNYQKRLNDNILYDIDVIEAPYNIENKWIEKDIEYYKKHNIEIILRSLFLQGKMLGEANNYEEYIQNAKKFNTSLVIGMTTIDQIEKNINCVRSDENGTKEKRNKYKL